MPTGTGKTFTFMRVAARRPGRVLVVAHRTELIKQAYRAALDAGLTVQIEQAEQHALRYSMFADGLSKVVVASVASLKGRRLKTFSTNAFDTIVVDEGHHTVAGTYRDVLNHFRDAKVLGVTATPDRGDKIALGSVYDSVAFEYSLVEAIAQGYLARPIIREVYPESEEPFAEAKAIIEQVGDRKTVLFCSSVDYAKGLADELRRRVGKHKVATVDCKTPPEERERLLGPRGDYEKGDIQFLLNFRVLTEGWDSPQTKAVGLLTAMGRAATVQCVGRGLRGGGDCLVLDLRGANAQHSLVLPEGTALDGIPLDRDVSDRLDESFRDSTKTLEELESLLDEQRRRNRERLQKDAERDSRTENQEASKDIDYETKERDGLSSEPPDDAPVTDKQIVALVRMGMDRKLAEGLTSAKAGRALQRLIDRSRRGLATYRQMRILKKYKFSVDISKDEAKLVITQLAANNWRPTAEMKERYEKR